MRIEEILSIQVECEIFLMQQGSFIVLEAFLRKVLCTSYHLRQVINGIDFV